MGHDEKDQDVINYLIVKGVDPSDALRQAIQFYDKDLFALILDKGKTDAALLSDALQMTETAKKTEMAEALKAKGAKIISYEMDPSTLGEFVGKYSDGGSGDVELVVKDGKLAFGQMGVVMPV